MSHTPFYYWERMKAEFAGAKGCAVRYHNGELSLQYHDTVVASFRWDADARDGGNCGVLSLGHGGWLTYYTKERINRFIGVLDLPLGLYQERKVWYVQTMPWSSHDRTRWSHIDNPNEQQTLEVQIGREAC